MPPDQALQALAQALAGTPAVNVLVAAEPNLVVIQRLNLRQHLATEFLSAARAAISIPGGNVVFKPYDPGYKPDDHELIYIELAQQQTIAEQIHQLSQV